MKKPTQEEIKAELKRRHNTGEITGNNRFYLDVAEAIENIQAENKKLKARVRSEKEIRNEEIKAEFVDSDIEYLCMLASYGRTVVQAGWLKIIAAKIKDALDKIKDAESKNKAIRDLQFSPSGDNHHNAALCPHCGDPVRKLQAKLTEAEAERETLRDTLGEERNKWHIEINDLHAELEKHRWIPVAEGLPEKEGWYFVYGLDTVTTGRFLVCEKTPNIWVGGGDFVTHWKPIIRPKENKK